MQITVFGASGRVGQQLVERCLDGGHTVVAFVHRKNPFSEQPNVRIVKGEIQDASVVNEALQGSAAVISTLGSWGTKDKNTLTTGMQTIIPAMEQQGIKRLITLTGDAALWSGDNPNVIDKLTHSVLGVLASKILKDGEAHLQLLEQSSLEWTSLRSPVMTGKNSAKYSLVDHARLPLAVIPRKAVVQALVDQLTAKDQIRKAPILR